VIRRRRPPDGGRVSPLQATAFTGGRDFGGGYTYLAIVAETQPITHPKKTSRKTLNLSFLIVPTNAKMTTQTRAQPML
jgi:hypothetical protein